MPASGLIKLIWAVASTNQGLYGFALTGSIWQKSSAKSQRELKNVVY